ncbi:GNAT family N-acetyltransferase [Macrococcus armenti]|uniref:GNAT family N-acetyltransferase n=1 Tax=Macrococcus armenti TaxID=2875764 RepID=UPI001CCAABE9|nr:GNAT family protein [Macrococcus armenti]UBH12118.1 GNAT family N-acetyltransferase [Macrococcus armenti]
MKLRLREIDLCNDLEKCAEWYRSERVLLGSEGKHITVYDEQTVFRMYSHLNRIGNVYIIECFFENKWLSIGDITLSPVMIPIVIGDDRFIGQGFGKRALKLLIEIAQFYQYSCLTVSKVFSYNKASQRLFESLGFVIKTEYIDEHDELCYSYELIL